MPTPPLSVSVPETPQATNTTSATQTSTNPSPPRSTTAVFIAIGVTSTFVLGIVMLAIVVIAVILACKNKRNKFSDNVSSYEYVESLDQPTDNPGKGNISRRVQGNQLKPLNSYFVELCATMKEYCLHF